MPSSQGGLTPAIVAITVYHGEYLLQGAPQDLSHHSAKIQAAL
jgi:hypothetical protein